MTKHRGRLYLRANGAAAQGFPHFVGLHKTDLMVILIFDDLFFVIKLKFLVKMAPSAQLRSRVSRTLKTALQDTMSHSYQRHSDVHFLCVFSIFSWSGAICGYQLKTFVFLCKFDGKAEAWYLKVCYTSHHVSLQAPHFQRKFNFSCGTISMNSKLFKMI